MAQDIHPISRFQEWYAEAQNCGLKEPTAMALATSTPDGHPSLRMVLLKEVDERGFVFYTNLNSRKGQELAGNPHVALCFHWQPLGKQVRVEGKVEPVTKEEADTYYASRARTSRIGAWASRQSQPMNGMQELMARVAEKTVEFGVGPIPRPDFWSGFRVIPARIEFWNEGRFRLHERHVYTCQTNGDWQSEMLFP